MRSLIIIEVEHGEDIADLAVMAEEIQFKYSRPWAGRAYVKDYTVRVDLPPCFVLDSAQVAPEWCEDCDTDHEPGKCPLGD